MHFSNYVRVEKQMKGTTYKFGENVEKNCRKVVLKMAKETKEIFPAQKREPCAHL